MQRLHLLVGGWPLRPARIYASLSLYDSQGTRRPGATNHPEPAGTDADPNESLVAADVRRLILRSGRILEPPHVGCYAINRGGNHPIRFTPPKGVDSADESKAARSGP